jgi:hypothetical protein
MKRYLKFLYILLSSQTSNITVPSAQYTNPPSPSFNYAQHQCQAYTSSSSSSSCKHMAV